MIQSNKIFRAHLGCWGYDASIDDPKYSEKPIFTFFSCLIEQKTRFDASMAFKMTHLRIYGRKIIFRYFQLVRISYPKLDSHAISRFPAVFIINNRNDVRYKSGTMNTKR
jgi:hypothetical protein